MDKVAADFALHFTRDFVAIEALNFDGSQVLKKHAGLFDGRMTVDYRAAAAFYGAGSAPVLRSGRVGRFIEYVNGLGLVVARKDIADARPSRARREAGE